MSTHFSFFFNIPILKSLCLWLLWALCKLPLSHCPRHSVSWGFPKSARTGLSSRKQAPDSCILAKSFEKYNESWCFLSLLDFGWRMGLCGWVLLSQIRVWSTVPSMSTTVTFVLCFVLWLSIFVYQTDSLWFRQTGHCDKPLPSKEQPLSLQKICFLPWLTFLFKCLTGQRIMEIFSCAVWGCLCAGWTTHKLHYLHARKLEFILWINAYLAQG